MLIVPRRFQAAGALWTPAQINPDIWHDASDTATVTVSGSSVSQWNDKSGNNRHIQQAAAASQPVYTAAAQNGRNVITFDGVNDILSAASVGSSGLVSVSMLAVFKMLSGGSSEDTPIGIGQTGAVGEDRVFYRSSSSSSVGFASWARDVPTSSISYDINGSYHIFGCWNTQLSVSTPNVRLMRDGTVISATTSSAMSLTANGFSVGSLQGAAVANYYTNFQVGEILVFYNAISDTNRQLCEGYFAHRWGLVANLPADHPYKSAAPTV